MVTAKQHYDELLAEHYTWTTGPFEKKSAEQRAVFERFGIAGDGRMKAVDLGCGPGAQSVALAQLGFRVRSIDFSSKMLAELALRRGDLPIEIVEGDIRNIKDLAGGEAHVVVCMGDTLSHLESKADVRTVLAGAADVLVRGGRIVVGFRDQTVALTGLDRFISIQTGEDAIMTCFLEYEPETIVVNDLIHVRENAKWRLCKSCYRKLRLDPGWVAATAQELGFVVDHRDEAFGLVTLVARK